MKQVSFSSSLQHTHTHTHTSQPPVPKNSQNNNIPNTTVSPGRAQTRRLMLSAWRSKLRCRCGWAPGEANLVARMNTLGFRVLGASVRRRGCAVAHHQPRRATRQRYPQGSSLNWSKIMTWLKRVERGGRKMGKAWENIGYSVQTAGEEPYFLPPRNCPS